VTSTEARVPAPSPPNPSSPKRTNVLHIRSQYIVDGGVETFVNALITHSNADHVRHDVAVFTTPDIDRPSFCESLFEGGGRDGRHERIRWDKTRLLFPVIRAILRIVDQRDIQVIHAHDNRANLIALAVRSLLGRPVAWLASAHGWVRDPVKSHLIGMVDRALMPLADMAHFASASLFGQIRRRPPERIAAVPYFLDVSEFASSYDSETLRRRWGIPDDCLVLGMVGRLGPEKGHVYLLRAYAQVAERFAQTRLVVVGDGPIRAEVEQVARELGLADRVVFTGFHEDAIEACAAFDVLVHSSLTETLSISIMEALQLGKPIVATTVGANADSVHHGRNGFLVPAGDATALADAVIELLGDSDRIASFAAESREISKRFSADVIAREYEALYERLAGRAVLDKPPKR